jgi:hypothetical protein
VPGARQLLLGLLLRRTKRLPTHSVRSASHAQLGTRRLLARPMTARTGFADFVRMLGLLAALIGCSGKATGSSAPAEVSPEDAGRPEKGTLCPPAVAGGAPAQCQTEESECCCGSECCSGVCFDGLCAAPCGGFGARCERAESTPANSCCSTACGADGCLCGGLGAPCISNADCCSRFCNGDISACDEPRIGPPARDRPARCGPK